MSVKERSTKHLLYKRYFENNIEIVELNTTSGRRSSIFRRILNYISFSIMVLIAGFRIRSIDIVYTRTPPILINFSGWILSSIKRASFVLEIGDLHPDESVALGLIKNKYLIFIWEKWEYFFRKRADLIVAVVPGIRKLLLQKGFSDKKIEVITNGFDPDSEHKTYQTYENDVAAKLQQLPSDCFFIAYAGSMGRAIPLEYIVESARLIYETTNLPICFIFIGDGEKKTKLQESCQSMNINNCIFFEPIESSLVTAFLEKMDVLIHAIPSGGFHEYNLPNKIFTYLGTKKTILFSGAGDVADIIKKANCGLVVPPEDSEKIKDSILYLYENKNSLSYYGQNGYDYVTKYYDREKILNKLDDRLRTL